MSTWVVKLESDGVVSLPKELLDGMHIQEGDELFYEVRGREIILVQAQEDKVLENEIRAE